MVLQSVVDLVSSTGSGWLATLIKVVVGVITAAVFVVKGLDHVEQGDLALKTRFGRVVRHRFGRRAGKPKIIGPGLRVLIPFVDALRKTTIRQRLGEIAPQIRHSHGHYEEVRTKIRFRVMDIYAAQLFTEDLEGTVIALCEKHLRCLLAEGVDYEAIPAQLKIRVAPEVVELGIAIDDFVVASNAATIPTQFFTQFTECLTGLGITPEHIRALAPHNGHKPPAPAEPSPTPVASQLG